MANPSELRADNAPVTAAVLDQAIAWQLSGAQPGQHRGLADWLAAHPEHARAWQQLEALEAPWQTLRHPAASQALFNAPARAATGRRTRRTLLTGLLLAGTGLWGAERWLPTRHLLSHELTHTGEVRHLTLPDGTRLALDSRSALDIDYNAAHRQVRLHTGTVWVQPAPDTRPFAVLTADGHLQTRDSRYQVSRDAAATTLVVLHDQVQAQAGSGPVHIVKAGQRARLQAGGFERLPDAPAFIDAWRDGLLVVEQRSAADVVAALARYTPGHLAIAPALADLQVTGTFPLHDPTLAMATLAHSLGAVVVTRTPWWQSIEPRPSA